MKTNFYGFVSGATNREREKGREPNFSQVSTTDTNPPFSKNKPNRISHKRQQKKKKKKIIIMGKKREQKQKTTDQKF